MSLYTLGKFLHIASALVLVGSYLLAPVLYGALRRIDDVRALRALARLQQRVSAASGPAAVLVLASGVYVTLAGWSFTRARGPPGRPRLEAPAAASACTHHRTIAPTAASPTSPWSTPRRRGDPTPAARGPNERRGEHGRRKVGGRLH